MDPKGAIHLDQYHQKSDVDSSIYALHHTLGINSNQSSPGPHTHDGTNSKFLPGANVGYVITTDQPTINNNVTPANDTQLIYPLIANAKYEMEIFALFNSTVACNFRTNWIVPSGATGLKQCFGSTGTVAAYTSRTNTPVRIGAHAFGTNGVYVLENTGLDQLCWERGIIQTSTTAGNFTFQWAQGIATVGNLVRDSWSYLKATRIE